MGRVCASYVHMRGASDNVSRWGRLYLLLELELLRPPDILQHSVTPFRIPGEGI